MINVYGPRYVRKKKNIQQIIYKRNFEAAKTDRLTADWLTGDKKANEILRWQLKKLRDRSRDLWKNNDYAKGFGRKLKSNVIGSQGISLQNKAKIGERFDEKTNNKIEEAFAEWSKPANFTVTGQQSRQDFEMSLVETISRDGEGIVRKVPGFNNDFRFALQYIPADQLDENLNKILPNRNQIVNGVEYNSYLKPVAYHFKITSSDYAVRHERVEAQYIQHIYLRDLDINQSRGVPWAHTAILRLRNIGAYEEAAIVASRVGASGMGFIVQAEDADSEYQGEEDSGGTYLDDVEPGAWRELKSGQTVQTYSPAYPHVNHSEFVKSMLRGATAGMGMNYHSVSGDLDGVNYSSIRQGVLEDRDIYKSLTKFLITYHNEDYYPEWLQWAIFAGKLDLVPGRFDSYNKSTWVGRGFDWVDPLKDVTSKLKEIENKLTSPQRVIREKGLDPEEILDEHVAWDKMLTDKGLKDDSDEGTANSQ